MRNIVMIFSVMLSLVARSACGDGAKAPAAGAASAKPEVELYPDPAKVTFEKFESPEGKFSVSVPSGWDRVDSYLYKKDDKVSGIMLQGPENMEGASMKIAVLYYAGTGRIKGSDDYIGRVLSVVTRIDAKKETKFDEVEVAGKKGKTFTFAKFDFVFLPFDAPPMEEGVMYDMNQPSRRVNMKVRYVVIPAEPGFYSLSYEAPVDMYQDFAGVFDTVVRTFELTGK